MPSGWDGLETIEHLWYVDPDIQIVICSAYSDHPWEDVSRRIGDIDKLLILMKPFHSIEVVQSANSLTKKWNLARLVKLQIEVLAFSVNRRTAELREAKPQDDAMEVLRQKEEFLAIMSHEIFVPMNELVGKVALLCGGALNPEQREHMATIQRCAQDVLTLLKDMHQFMAGPRRETHT